MSDSPVTDESGRDQEPRSLLAWGVLLFAGMIWGVTFSLMRIAVEGGAHPVGLGVVQSLIGGVALSTYLLARRRRLPLSSRHLRFYLICGIAGTALPGTLYFYAAAHLSAGVLAITIATVPMLTLALALIVRIERPVIGRILGLLLGIVGVGFIVLPESSLPDPESVPWVLLALVCAACYAIENTYIALKMPEDVDALTVLCGMMGVATLLLTVVALFINGFYLPAWPPTRIEWAVLAMSLINVGAYAMFVFLIGLAGPVFASQMAYIVTLSGVAWGMVLFGEQHSGWIWASLVILTIGMVLVKPDEDQSVDQ